VTEKYHDQLAAILVQWAADLLHSPRATEALAKSLSSDFSGTPLTPSESMLMRSGGIVEIRQNKFSHAPLQREAFLQSWSDCLNPFSKLLTAEFQITRIDDQSALLKTRVRYELVGTGPDFHREQRLGEWELEWQASAGGFLVRRWQALEETRSRSLNPVYVDTTAVAFSRNPSYQAQLQRGADHWRTVLDVACGIDIYGHNGVSVGDINGNGFDDLYICQPAGLPNRLYRNRGDGTFEDITEASGLGLMENTACALFADIDNDGHQDLIVVRTDGPELFLNDGKGNFRRKPNAFHFATPPQGTFTGAAIADYDRDGYLDIYFCLYLYYQGTDQYKYPSPYFAAENGPPNFLMKNNRDGTFVDVTKETGLSVNNTRYSFCCAWSDFNNNGWPDLYVVNDFGRKNLYRNNGDGTFTDIAPQTGVEDIGAGMSVCAFDYDNDGNQDLYVANMWTAAGERISAKDVFQKDAPPGVRAQYQKHAMGNSLFHNRGDGKFEPIAAAAMGRWAWSSDAWDFDHDGFSDLYITNGMVSGPNRSSPTEDLNSFFWRQVVANSPAEAKPAADYEQGWNALNELLRSDATWSGYERNVFYANNDDGSFSDISAAIDLDFLEDGRSFALADFNHDGRLEVFLKNRNAPQLRVLQNVVPDLPASIAFRLQGTKSNRDAIGTKMTIENELGPQTRTLQAGSGFLSQHTKEVFFGLGVGKSSVKAAILWPSGLVQNLSNLPANHRVWVTEGSESVRTEAFDAPAPREEIAVPRLEPVPVTIETWLIAPIAAPDVPLPDSSGQVRTLKSLRGRPVLVAFESSESDLAVRDRPLLSKELAVIVVTVPADSSDSMPAPGAEPKPAQDAAAVYNLLCRNLFDRHRDLTLPTSFLIDKGGLIVKIYQGPIDIASQLNEDARNIPTTPAQRLARALPFPVVTDNADFRRNYLSLGSVFFQHGYYEQSEDFFRTSLQDDPNSAEAHYGLGSACLKLQKNSEAQINFQRATQLRAAYPDTLANAWNNLGLLATQQGQTAAAIPSFQEALRQNPEHLIALVNLGNAYRQQHQWQEARETLTHALDLKPDDPDANYALGMVFAQTDDTIRAFDRLQKALQARPNYPEALSNLGVLYLRTGRRDDAVAAFQKCISLAPAFDQSYLNLARVYALEGEPDKARALLLELLKLHPGNPQAQTALEQLASH
jgi:tetratricopeptide (TPR) repeat protein